MGRPDVATVVVEAVELGHVLRVADALEDPHVFAARKHKGVWKAGVHAHDLLHHIVIVRLPGGGVIADRDEVAPESRRIRRRVCRARRDGLGEVELKVPLEVPLYIVA
jgi:hypothetical protein